MPRRSAHSLKEILLPILQRRIDSTSLRRFICCRNYISAAFCSLILAVPRGKHCLVRQLSPAVTSCCFVFRTNIEHHTHTHRCVLMSRRHMLPPWKSDWLCYRSWKMCWCHFIIIHIAKSM